MREDFVLADYKNPDASTGMRLSIQLLCNTSPEKIAENIRINSVRNVEWLARQERHDLMAVIVGGGPSASDHVEEIKELSSQGVVFALNNASRWIGSRGVPVDYQCIIDAQPDNIQFIDNQASHQLLASQVDPSLFEASERPMLMHLMTEGLEEHIPPERKERGGYVLLGGGYGVGNTALCAVYALGYRTIHCFGLDSSHRGLAGHAYDQPMNDGIPCVETEWKGRKYISSAPMKAHAEHFQTIAADLKAAGCEIHVYGDGLLPAMFNEP